MREPWRILLISLGVLSTALGVIGIFLPLVPTTPFLLLAAYLFQKSSPKFHAWLYSHPQLGPVLREWNEHRAIEPRVKWICTLFLSVSVGYLVFLSERPLWLKGLVCSISFTVLLFVWTRPSDKK